MRGQLWEALSEGFIKIGSVGLDCRYLPVHKLVFRRRSLQPIFREQHGIFGVVDVQEDLHRDHCLDVLRTVIQRGKVIHHLVHTESDLLANTRLVLLP